MKNRYSYFSLRFPGNLAVLCHRVEDELNAFFFDLPFLLPINSTKCKYNDTDTISFLGKEYYMASEKMDVCFEYFEYSRVHCFGLINITKVLRMNDNKPCIAAINPKFVFWSNFYDEKLVGLLDAYEGMCDIRLYSNPTRISATLVSNKQ